MAETARSRLERRQLAEELLDAVGLSGRAHARPLELSGGERQRVAIARGLANDPQLLLADEPTGNLDSESSGRILTLLTTLQRERGLTVVMVTHASDIAAIAHRVVQMRDGRIASGPLPHLRTA